MLCDSFALAAHQIFFSEICAAISNQKNFLNNRRAHNNNFSKKYEHNR
jgi:hypothetical protein